jgi:hypothetical protein
MKHEILEVATQSEIATNQDYTKYLEQMMNLIRRNTQPFYFLPGRSAIALGKDLIIHTKTQGVQLQTKFFMFPCSSDHTPEEIYTKILLEQVKPVAQAFGTKSINFLDDYVMAGGKSRTMSDCLSGAGFDINFIVLTSWFTEHNPLNVTVIHAGNRDLMQTLQERIGLPFNNDILPTGYPNELL